MLESRECEAPSILLIKLMKLQFKVMEPAGSRVVVPLSGSISEDSAEVLACLRDVLAGAIGVLDLHDITAMNSVGAKLWMTFITSLSQETTYSYTRVSPTMLTHFCLLSSLRGSGPILSCVVEFLCAECGGMEKRIVDKAAVERGETAIQECGGCAKLGKRAVLEMVTAPEQLEILASIT